MGLFQIPGESRELCALSQRISGSKKKQTSPEPFVDNAPNNFPTFGEDVFIEGAIASSLLKLFWASDTSQGAAAARCLLVFCLFLFSLSLSCLTLLSSNR